MISVLSMVRNPLELSSDPGVVATFGAILGLMFFGIYENNSDLTNQAIFEAAKVFIFTLIFVLTIFFLKFSYMLEKYSLLIRVFSALLSTYIIFTIGLSYAITINFNGTGTGVFEIDFYSFFLCLTMIVWILLAVIDMLFFGKGQK